MQFLKDVNIDFMSKRKIGAVLSAFLILVGIASLVARGGPNYGIDFTGGTSIRLQFEKPIEVGSIRDILAGIGLANSEIKKIGESNEVLIRVQQQEEIEEVSERITSEIANNLQDNSFELRERDTVGPRIGNELRRAAIWAILVALGLILVYISWRFQFKFAVGAVVALFHDVIITLGAFSILDLEISLAVVAAFLTIVGYSLNDTIVVFDRIRENLKLMRRENFNIIINRSINQTLSRTVLTSLTTFIVVIILFFFGGEVIHNFSFALLVGVIIGTYSSVFVASPLVYEWQIRKEQQKGKNLSRR
ncbi:protein translocase subunit SecF [candidate division KSB1 bacterium]|nr:protein translocase subunit SecF [candidate division KSB1 bacterium]